MSMKLVERNEFEAEREAIRARMARISWQEGQGFQLDLDYALTDWDDLSSVQVTWRGEDECVFAASGEFQGDAAEVERKLLAVLDEKCIYSEGGGVASVAASADRLRVSFLTWTTRIGFVTACIDFVRQTSGTQVSHTTPTG